MKDKYTGSIKHGDIYKTLEHNGILLLNPVDNEAGKVIRLEEAITEILQKSEEIREVETVPTLLLKDQLIPKKLIEYTLLNNILEKVGYLAEKTQDLTEKSIDLQAISALLKIYIDTYKGEQTGEIIPLVEGQSAELSKENHKRTELEKRWNIFDPIAEGDYLIHINNLHKH